MHIRRPFVVALSMCVAYLTSCGDVHQSRARVSVRADTEVTDVTGTTIDREAIVRQVRAMQRANAVRRAQLRHDVNVLVWTYAVQQAERAALVAAHERAEAARRASHPQHSMTNAPAHPVTATANAVSGGGDCQALLAKYFGDDLAWAQHVAQRESHCTAGAVNAREGCDSSGRTNSHAMGVFQMCYPMHQPTFLAVGCDAPLDMECNIKAARALYNGVGRGPWGG